jgi:hypothetical protein
MYVLFAKGASKFDKLFLLVFDWADKHSADIGLSSSITSIIFLYLNINLFFVKFFHWNKDLYNNYYIMANQKRAYIISIVSNSLDCFVSLRKACTDSCN